jgi:quercetin dioxygenase-like cupin family protein
MVERPVAPVQRVLRLHNDASTARAGDVGAALRAARRARRLSLAQVAEATAISRSLLSLVETGRSDITVGRLVRLCGLYGIRVSDLVAEAPPPEHAVVRTGERRRLELEAEGIALELLTPDGRSTFLPFLAELAPGGGASESVSHPGEEFVHVLEGRVRLEVDGSEPVILETGDSAYYGSGRGHRWANAGDGPARLLSVATPPPL